MMTYSGTMVHVKDDAKVSVHVLGGGGVAVNINNGDGDAVVTLLFETVEAADKFTNNFMQAVQAATSNR